MKKIILPLVIAGFAIVLIGQSFLIYRLAKKVNVAESAVQNDQAMIRSRLPADSPKNLHHTRQPINIFTQKWDPFAEIDQMQRYMDELFHNAFHYGPGFSMGAGEDLFSRQMNIEEEKENYVLTVALPGADAEDVKVEVKNGILNIQAQNNSRQEENKDGYQSYYQSASLFSRAIPLPDDASGEDIKANIEKGILKVIIPKLQTENQKPVTIPVL